MTISKTFGKGKFTSVYAASTQGLHGVFISLLVLFPLMSFYNANFGDVYAIVISAFVEFTMLVLSFVFTMFSKQRNFRFIFTKKGFAVMLAGVFGGAIGTTLLTLGIVYAGASYGVVLSTLFPAISAIVSHWLFREKMKIVGLIALVGVAISAILLTVLENDDSYKNLFLGIFLGALAGIGWAAEALIVSWVFRKSQNIISDSQMLLMRQMGSVFTMIAVMLPLMPIILGHNFNLGFEMVEKFSIEAGMLFALLGLGANLFFSWLAFFNAIKWLGSTNATTVNITYVVWAPIFTIIINAIVGWNLHIPSWSYWVFSVTLIISVIFVIRNVSKPKEK